MKAKLKENFNFIGYFKKIKINFFFLKKIKRCFKNIQGKALKRRKEKKNRHKRKTQYFFGTSAAY